MNSSNKELKSPEILIKLIEKDQEKVQTIISEINQSNLELKHKISIVKVNPILSKIVKK